MLFAPNQLMRGLQIVLEQDLSNTVACKYQQACVASSAPWWTCPDGNATSCAPAEPSDYFAFTRTGATLYAQDSTMTSPAVLVCFVASLLCTVLYLLLLYFIDVFVILHGGCELSSLLGSSAAREAPAPSEEDDDVMAERARVRDGGSAAGDWVRVNQLRKVWRTGAGLRFRQNGQCLPQCVSSSRNVAVENLSFGIAPGTCFALLGPNGAGKTTAIGMLTGDVTPSGGDAFVCGLSVRSQLPQIFRRSGFCPQFNGLWDALTVRQHLTFYMRLKGVPQAFVAQAVEAVLEDYGVREHADKKSKSLSGGTRRKLSAAIALACGRPDVVFLDEPTTGVDVGTRRFIWDRILTSVHNRVILLTTHYMDEADALANVIGIMAKGRLRALGSGQHLKSRFGGGYRIECKGPLEHAQAVIALVHEVCGSARVIEEHGGTISFEAAASFELGAAFRRLEVAKAQGLVENYSLSQTNLEQVFLNIAAQASSEAERLASVQPSNVRAPATALTLSSMPLSAVPAQSRTDGGLLTLSIVNDKSKSFGISIGPAGQILNISPTGLAATAGMQVKDKILTVDGRELQEVDAQDALFAQMRKIPDAATVTFTIQREGLVASGPTAWSVA